MRRKNRCILIVAKNQHIGNCVYLGLFRDTYAYLYGPFLQTALANTSPIRVWDHRSCLCHFGAHVYVLFVVPTIILTCALTCAASRISSIWVSITICFEISNWVQGVHEHPLMRTTAPSQAPAKDKRAQEVLMASSSFQRFKQKYYVPERHQCFVHEHDIYMNFGVDMKMAVWLPPNVPIPFWP